MAATTLGGRPYIPRKLNLECTAVRSRSRGERPEPVPRMLHEAKALVEDLARHLDKKSPARQDVLDLATAMNGLATATSRAAVGRSVALQVRHHLAEHEADVRAAVRDAAKELRDNGGPLQTGVGDYVASSLLAPRLGMKARQMSRLLKTRAGRRSLAWPLHVGNGLFKVHVEAVGANRAALLLTIPDVEPPHPVPLPEGYET